jgi:hypothetical protein
MTLSRILALIGSALGLGALAYTVATLEPPSLPPPPTVSPSIQAAISPTPSMRFPTLQLDAALLRDRPVFEAGRRMIEPPPTLPVAATAPEAITAATPSEPPPTPPEPLPVFAGVIMAGVDRLAILSLPDQQAVSVGLGQSAGRWRVVEIEPRHIRLAGHDGTSVLLPLQFGSEPIADPSVSAIPSTPTTITSPQLPSWIITPAHNRTR